MKFPLTVCFYLTFLLLWKFQKFNSAEDLYKMKKISKAIKSEQMINYAYSNWFDCVENGAKILKYVF